MTPREAWQDGFIAGFCLAKGHDGYEERREEYLKMTHPATKTLNDILGAGDMDATEEAETVLEALTAAGFAVVPVEPTEAMIEAEHVSCIGMEWPGSPEEMNKAVVRARWQAMIRAAQEGE